MLNQYTGLSPSNVNKDAKYSVVSGSQGDEIRLIYRVNARERYLLTTSHHTDLVGKVNAVKIEATGQPRGAFYINEFGDVLVPDGSGGCYWAGYHADTLEFRYEGGIVSAKAPDDLAPGDTWPGPHVGVRYVLSAGGGDIKYELKEGNKRTIIFLSDEVGSTAAASLAHRLAQVMGSSGGRFYINERSELFSPGRAPDGIGAIYLGNLDEDAWFSPPDGYARP